MFSGHLSRKREEARTDDRTDAEQYETGRAEVPLQRTLPFFLRFAEQHAQRFPYGV